MSNESASSIVESQRAVARTHLEQGSVTAGYSADRPAVLQKLNEALATELVCMLRYRRHHFMAKGIHARGVAAEFLTHSNEELSHADRLAARIVQLGGEPNFAPDELTTHSHAEYVAGDSLEEMIRENLVAERIAIDSYRDLVRFLNHDDPTTSDMVKAILAVEEEHANDLADLLEDLPGKV
mgnify:CR=1 FL=1